MTLPEYLASLDCSELDPRTVEAVLGSKPRFAQQFEIVYSKVSSNDELLRLLFDCLKWPLFGRNFQNACKTELPSLASRNNAVVRLPDYGELKDNPDAQALLEAKRYGELFQLAREEGYDVDMLIQPDPYLGHYRKFVSCEYDAKQLFQLGASAAMHRAS